jgi:hypothetical protein
VPGWCSEGMQCPRLARSGFVGDFETHLSASVDPASRRPILVFVSSGPTREAGKGPDRRANAVRVARSVDVLSRGYSVRSVTVAPKTARGQRLRAREQAVLGSQPYESVALRPGC